MPGAMQDNMSAATFTGTPADNFPDVQRAQYCGTGEASSSRFITEYKIPTDCTQPLAITTDPDGNVWFAQVNTGRIAKFDPATEEFAEYDNPRWPQQGRSMFWGIDYHEGELWYTDEAYDSIWKYSVENGTYDRLDYPASDDSLPQKIEVSEERIIINDFTGGKITFLGMEGEASEYEEFPVPVNATLSDTGDAIHGYDLPSPVNYSLAGDFGLDAAGNIWYTNWIFQGSGVLVRFDPDGYSANASAADYLRVYELPADMETPNGAAVGPDGRIWIADTSSSFFFSFDPIFGGFTKYVTSGLQESSYGNATGVIRDPVSRPYWMEVDDSGRLVFNEQTANRLGVFDPAEEMLVEYTIPSKNPNWADCGENTDCGLAQTFGIALDGEKVWFTEWVENNIGVLDTSVPLPYEIEVGGEITVPRDGTAEISFTVVPLGGSSGKVRMVAADTAAFRDIVIEPDVLELGELDGPRTIDLTINTGSFAIKGTHKVLLGVQDDDVSVSRYVTVNIV
ncbi:streptogramin lyase [Cenarchaeum symbiosum A]|uniref:Streptogramin lyase n=1 Tax=Cenarchaeum symbiosum (strain A) TaxID=414004 RepID=A0RUY2_CENSY|nr:streptogramin lyase [Cenarchaeum symbiosum A]